MGVGEVVVRVLGGGEDGELLVSRRDGGDVGSRQ